MRKLVFHAAGVQQDPAAVGAFANAGAGREQQRRPVEGRTRNPIPIRTYGGHDAGEVHRENVGVEVPQDLFLDRGDHEARV
jgi:hypothetical protein